MLLTFALLYIPEIFPGQLPPGPRAGQGFGIIAEPARQCKAKHEIFSDREHLCALAGQVLLSIQQPPVARVELIITFAVEADAAQSARIDRIVN